MQIYTSVVRGNTHLEEVARGKILNTNNYSYEVWKILACLEYSEEERSN